MYCINATLYLQYCYSITADFNEWDGKGRLYLL